MRIAVARRLAALVALGAADAQLADAQSAKSADVIIQHAKVYTVDARLPSAQAIAVSNGRIVAVGSDADVAKWRGAKTTIVDAAGKVVLPGFTDTHVHFLEGALSLLRVNLEGAKDVADIQRRLRAYAASHPGNGWIQGRGWNYGMFGSKALPDKSSLDQIFPDRPVFLEGYDGHTTWANSVALRKAGITRDTPDPPNGIIVRDPRTREATGALKEAASRLVRDSVPSPSRQEKRDAYVAGMKWANAHGLTRVHSAGGDFEELALLDEVRRAGLLTLRFYIAHRVAPPALRASDLAAIDSARRRFNDAWLSAGAAKLMIDGVIESRTAAMLSPYADDSTQRGKLFWQPNAYADAITALDKAGVQTFTHAIGELGVRTALDGIQRAMKANKSNGHRARVEHIETIAANDVGRFGALGIIASMQPLHSYPDHNTIAVWARNIGPDRASRAWVWNRIASAKGRLSFGSDWPVVTLDPWEGIQTGVTRQTDEGKPPNGFVPSERLTVPNAINGYTMGAAYAGFRERDEGSISVGKLADVIMVSQDPFAVPPRTLGRTKVLLTMVAGKVVYRGAP